MSRLKNKWVRLGLLILVLGSIAIGIAAKGCWGSSSKHTVGSSAPAPGTVLFVGDGS